MAELLLNQRCMSKARPVVKNVSMMLTRRVRGRFFLLRPSTRTNQIIRYVVAVIAGEWQIDLHAITVLSNHWHVCLTDRPGNIVNFQRDCHTFIARALNAHHGEFESVWSSGQSSRVECVQPEDLVAKIAYTMANPVEAGLVRYGRSWPGVRHAWPCKPLEIDKPVKFFRGENDGGSWPEVADLVFTRPPGYEKLSDDELAAVVDEAVAEREKTLRAEFDARGRKYLGRRAVLAQGRHAKPSSRARHFRMSPKVACRDKWRRIERLDDNKRWSEAYEHARAQWSAGNRKVEFPHGTYKMRVLHDAVCASAPTSTDPGGGRQQTSGAGGPGAGRAAVR